MHHQLIVWQISLHLPFSNNLVPDNSIIMLVSIALHLVQPGLMAGKQADEIQVNFKIFKIACRLKYLSFHFI